jgi:alpha-methylacyl-CoA racemase
MTQTPQLDGITVLDLSSVGPASRASRMLADYGARVVKVAPTSSKGSVQIQPPFHTYGAGRGMQRIRVNLKHEAGVEVFLALAADADVVIESYRPGVASRLGIGFEAVRALNPGIVYCSTTGYGQDGPYATWAGHDINYLALAGFLACTEPRADGGPPIPGATIADSAGGGMHAVVAILAALVRRSVSGEGQYLDVSATEGVLSLMALSIDQYTATGEVAAPRETLLTGRYACYDSYEARDGKWLAVGAIEARFYANLCEAIGCGQHVAHQMDDAKQDEIRGDFKAAFLQRDRDDWVAELAPNDTCVAPVYTIPELSEDPHLAARGVFIEAKHAEHGQFRQVGPILAGGVREQPVHEVRPQVETDTDSLLRPVGYDDEKLAALRDDGVIE